MGVRGLREPTRSRVRLATETPGGCKRGRGHGAAQAWSRVGALVPRMRGVASGVPWGQDIAVKVRGLLGRWAAKAKVLSVSSWSGRVTLCAWNLPDCLSLLPPQPWRWVRGFILTSGKSHGDDSGALTGFPSTRGPGSLCPLRAASSGSQAPSGPGAWRGRDSWARRL